MLILKFMIGVMMGFLLYFVFLIDFYIIIDTFTSFDGDYMYDNSIVNFFILACSFMLTYDFFSKKQYIELVVILLISFFVFVILGLYSLSNWHGI